jgi:hypothetical protein
LIGSVGLEGEEMVVSRYRLGSAVDFFPTSTPATGHVIGYLARYDEIIALAGVMSSLEAGSGEFTARFSIMRAQIVALDDARRHVQRLLADPAFSEYLYRDEEVATRFLSVVEEVEKAQLLIRTFRDKAGAHIDAKDVVESLKRHGHDIQGGFWLSQDPHKNRFDIAHAIVLGMVVDRTSGAAQGHLEESAETILSEIANARGSLLRLLPDIVRIYAAIAPSSIPL